ncbi:MAG: hypothetical protein KIT34_17645 [Cyanobacteria bacterium TGS_CYA1]|nr:hypothetical protein [Cyanobacteria bacterium TGS_CYA1]
MTFSKQLGAILVIVIILVAMTFFLIATPVGNLYLRYIVSFIYPNRHTTSGIAKCYKKKPAEFEHIVSILMQEPFSDVLVTKKSTDEYQITNSNYFPVRVKPDTEKECINHLEKFGLMSISKKGTEVSFNTNWGMHKGDCNSLVYSETPLKKMDDIWGRDYFTLNEHWAIYLH